MKKPLESELNAGADRPAWISPKITKMGDIHEIVKGGGGKLSIAGGDPGEARKEEGTEPL